MNGELKQRLHITEVDPEAYKPLYALEKYIHSGTLGDALIEIVKVRASQINHCAYCLDMHMSKSRSLGIDQRKLDVVAAWHEAPSLFTAKERAAFLLTEEVTLIGEGGVSEETWIVVNQEFTEQEIVQLLMLICAINTWNRLAISVHQSLPE